MLVAEVGYPRDGDGPVISVDEPKMVDEVG